MGRNAGGACSCRLIRLSVSAVQLEIHYRLPDWWRSTYYRVPAGDDARPQRSSAGLAKGSAEERDAVSRSRGRRTAACRPPDGVCGPSGRRRAGASARRHSCRARGRDAARCCRWTSSWFASSACPVNRNWPWAPSLPAGSRFSTATLIRELGISQALVEQVAVRERLELERRDALYRAGRAAASRRRSHRPSGRRRACNRIDDGGWNRRASTTLTGTGRRRRAGGCSRNLRASAVHRRSGGVRVDARSFRGRRRLVPGILADDGRRSDPAPRQIAERSRDGLKAVP